MIEAWQIEAVYLVPGGVRVEFVGDYPPAGAQVRERGVFELTVPALEKIAAAVPKDED